jgi:hypothetical protein
MISTCDKVLKSLSYAGNKSSYVPHTYSVSQPPPSYVYSWRNRHPKITRIHGIITGLEDSQVLYSQLEPKSFNHWAMPDSSPHRYPTHTLSHNLSLTRVSVWDLWPNKYPKIAPNCQSFDQSFFLFFIWPPFFHTKWYLTIFLASLPFGTSIWMRTHPSIVRSLYLSELPLPCLTAFPTHLSEVSVVYYESIKREVKIKPTYECRCDGRLQTKRFTLLSYTGLVVELEHLKDEVNKREVCECEGWVWDLDAIGGPRLIRRSALTMTKSWEVWETGLV